MLFLKNTRDEFRLMEFQEYKTHMNKTPFYCSKSDFDLVAEYCSSYEKARSVSREWEI